MLKGSSFAQMGSTAKCFGLAMRQTSALVCFLLVVSLMGLLPATISFAQTVSFGPAANFAVGTRPISVAVGDLNGDGKPDLAVANRDSGNVSILFANPSLPGGFAAAVNLDVANPESVAIGDVNGDGRPDLVVANGLTFGTVSVLFNNAPSLPGGFTTPVSFAVGTLPSSVAIGDVNGDAFLDLVVSNYGSSNVSILLGNGTGDFIAPSTFTVGGSPTFVAIGDLNGDGRLDLAVANWPGDNVSVLLNNGNGTVSLANYAVGTQPRSIAIGDFNGDGKPDLAVANIESNDVSVLLGNGDGSFGSAATFGAGVRPASVAIGDLNGDGKLDLAFANTNIIGGTVTILLGTGTGGFSTPFAFPVTTNPYSVAIADLIGDDKPDLAVTTQTSNTVAILLNTTTWPPPDYDYLYRLNPKATYLRTNNDADAVAPNLVRLSDLGLAAGDIIQLRSVGKVNLCFQPSCGPFQGNLIGAFTSDETPPNAAGSNVIAAGPPIVTFPTYSDNLLTDLVGDFGIPAGGLTVVRIPSGAVGLWVSLHDSYYSDNSTPSILASDRLGFTIKARCPAPGVPAGLGAPYVCLTPELSQDLYATAREFFGGIAFAPDGDVLVTFCDNRYFPGAPALLRRFDAQTTTSLNGGPVHPQVPGSPFGSLAGCGLVNGPGGSVYLNSTNAAAGVASIDSNTGAVLAGPFGGRGNGLGIALDPQTGNLVYVGYDSEILFASPDGESSGVFSNATRDTTLAKVVDGIFFEPSGEFLFLAQFPQTLVVMNRAGAIVQNIFVSAQPDGISFHATTPKFVVTANTDGTLTRLDFPEDDYSRAPTQSLIASGGFRGDISQVGPDGCLFVPMEGTRFANGIISDVQNVGSDNSVVRICGGFSAPPAVLDADGDGVLSISDNSPAIYNPNQADKDGDGVGDASDPCPNYANNSICNYVETLSTPLTPVPQGAPLLVTATFKNDSGVDILTFPPDCYNTYFEVSYGGIILPPTYRHRKAYAIPDELITIPAGGQISVTCDLSKMFDVSVLQPRTDAYDVQATYSNFIRDPDLNDQLVCANAPCSNIWIGSKTSEKVKVTISSVLGDPSLKGVNIDIKPGTFPNDWSCKSMSDNIPVGLLSSVTFDATQVNVNDVRFGKLGSVAGAAELHRKGAIAAVHGAEDLNGDGLLDRIFHFNAKDTGFSCSDIPSGQSQTTVFGYLKVLGTPIAGADRLLIKR